MRYFIIIALLVVGSFISPAYAQDAQQAANASSATQEASSNVSAAAVYHTCKDYFEHKFNSAARENVGRKSGCISYFFGAGSMVLLLNNKNVETGLCLPETLSTDEMIRLFNKWMEKNQDRAQDIATVALYDALQDSYPCSGIVPLGSE